MENFVHLHVHTGYSMLDGATKPEQLVSKARALGMPALAITDHANLYGVVDFYKACTNQGIKPIIGVEAYFAHDANQKTQRDSMHIVLLAKDSTGYYNLNRLMTRANLEGFYYVPRIDWAMLEQHHEGLIATSACIHGVLSRSILQDNIDEAVEFAIRMQDIFGKGNYYLELMYHGIEQEARVIQGILEIHKRTGIPLVVTNDVHYRDKEDCKIRNTLTYIRTNTNKLVDDGTLHLRTLAEMHEALHGIPQSAFNNTLLIADMVNFKMQFGTNHMPFVPNADEQLEQKVWDGIRYRYGDAPSQTILDRVNYELSVIKKMGFASYFLIVQDYVQWAKEHGIPVGYGRGSAVGSIVAYALGITDVEPLQYNLLFERFLNPSRVSMPDIDVDFGEGRNEVIRYISDKYGQENTAQVLTIYYYGGKSAFRDVARIMNIPVAEVEALQLPDSLKDLNIDNITTNHKIREALTIAKQIEGLPRHSSVHAGGVVIADKPLYNYVALERNTSDTIALDVVTQQDKSGIESLGLLKMDLLGLKNLDVVQQCVDLIKQKHHITPKIDINDPAIYSLLREGKVAGLFQVEGEGFREFLLHLQPTQFSDVYAALALYRPGTLDSGGADTYIRRKHGLEPVDYFGVPELEPILKETYGVIVYQEQVMQIASVISGYSLSEADLLRRAIGKKDKAIIDKQRNDFVSRAKNKQVAERIYNVIEKFAEYGFNKSHAVAYAYLTMTTAWLKYYYPIEFWTTLLRVFSDKPDKINYYLSEIKQEYGYGYAVPDINLSDKNWTFDGYVFRPGLGCIKKVQTKTIDRILQERVEHGPYKSLQDLQKRAKPDKSTLTGLIRSGALESIGVPRNEVSQLPREIESILDSIYNNIIPPHVVKYPLNNNEYLLQRIIRVDDNSIFVLVDANGNTYEVEIDDRDWLQDLLQSSRRLYETAMESDLDERINSRTFGAILDNIVIRGQLIPIGASRYKLRALE